MKRRDYKYITSALNVAKSMLTIKVSDLDKDPVLLNTPRATYNLEKGIAGEQPHDPFDLITKITECSPGDEGMDIWLHVHWDNGCSLGVVYGEDSCRKLNTVKVICYNDEEEWDSREDALEFYMKAMAGSEGSEQERYAKIVAELAMGKAVCTDGEE